MRKGEDSHGRPVRLAERLLLVAVLLLLALRFRPAGEQAPPPTPALVHRIDLNRSPWHELVHLPGIGPARAQAIVADREARGPYPDPGALDRVPGIGPATARAIREALSGE